MAASGKEKGKKGKGRGNIAFFVRELVESAVKELGYSLWDVEYVKEGAFYYLRFTIDTPARDGLVTIDDCEKVHRRIEPLIDEADPIEDFYYMEVSSPGIERIIRTDAHFAWALERGETLCLKLFAAYNGRKELVGRLLAASDEVLTLEVEGEKIILARSAVSKAALYYDYDSPENKIEKAP